MPNSIIEPAHLAVENITVSYNGHPALSDVSFQVPQGTHVAIVGSNGAGKSTLFKALVGLMPLKSGRIMIHGKPWGHHLDCVAYVPQREEVDWHFPVTVSDVVMMGRYGQLGWLKRPGKKDYAVVARSLEQMNIANLALKPIGDLSGGQQQRVFLARALAQEPHILLMDEPFTGIDASTQEATLTLLDELKRQQVTVMVSTHDLNLAGSRFDQVLLLNRHVIAYGTPAQVFTAANVTSAFGAHAIVLDGKSVVVDDCCPPEMFE
ncbi:MAG: metal ABC transporter ATP-binding protein [Chloroflexi bacterium]|nr:metal ABC transporter ATP-binding protein [Chloroflexota bacterium]